MFASLTIPEPPPAPPGYTLCAYEVRSLAGDPSAIDSVGVYGGVSKGLARAVKKLTAGLREARYPFRLAAVAWWIDDHLETCVNGRERLVSVYDVAGERWSEWVSEEKIGVRYNTPVKPCYVRRFGHDLEFGRRLGMLAGTTEHVAVESTPAFAQSEVHRKERGKK